MKGSELHFVGNPDCRKCCDHATASKKLACGRLTVVPFDACSSGLALFFASEAFLDNSLVEVDDAAEQLVPSGVGGSAERHVAGAPTAPPPSQAALVLRCSAALTGSVMHNTGFWTILDVYTGKEWQTCSDPAGASTSRHISCVMRNLFFIVVGLAMLAASGTLHSNAAISPLATLQVDRSRLDGAVNDRLEKEVAAKARRARTVLRAAVRARGGTDAGGAAAGQEALFGLEGLVV